MDALRRTWNQFLDLYRSMSPSQRGTLIAVPLLVLAGLGLLMYQNRSSPYVPVSWGKTFGPDDLSHAQKALHAAGLGAFRIEGQQILAPSDQVERYNAALLLHDGLPSDWTSEWEKQYDRLNVFSPSGERDARRDMALQKQLRLMIRVIPEIEDAQVTWAAASQSGFLSKNSRMKATVWVRSRGGRELSSKLVRSLQQAVAGAVGQLSAADVTVFDQTNSQSYTGEQPDDPLNDQLQQRIRDFERNYQSKIAEALGYIPGVLVAVHVDLDNLRSSKLHRQVIDPKKTATILLDEQRNNETFRRQGVQGEPGQAPNRPRELAVHSAPEQSRVVSGEQTNSVSAASFEIEDQVLLGAMPKAVQVSVQIPRSYYQQVALSRSVDSSDEKKFEAALQQIEADVLLKVEQAVRPLVPANSPPEAISVQSIDLLHEDVPELSVPLTETVGNLASRWGGAAGLALFALWALWMLHKSTPAAVEPDEEPLASVSVTRNLPDEDPDDDAPSGPTRRDQIQLLVRDNPEVAATVLRKWIQSGK